MNKITTFFIVLFICFLLVGQEKTMSLQNCIEYALKNSPELKKEKIDLLRQELNTIEAQAAFAFSLNANSDYAMKEDETSNSITLSKEFRNGLNVSMSADASLDYDDKSDSSGMSITLSKQILGGDSRLENTNIIDDSIIDEIIIANNLRKIRRSLIFSVKKSFYKIIRFQQSMTIQQRRLEQAKRNLEFARAKENPLDIATAEIEVPSNQLSLITAERIIEREIDSLKEILGMPIEENVSISKQFDFKITNRSSADDIDFALNNHEDFLNNKLYLHKYKLDAEIAKYSLYPDVSLSAKFSKDSRGATVNLNGDDEQTYMLTARWELGRRSFKADYQSKLYNISEKKLDYYILKQNKIKTIKELLLYLRERVKAIKIQGKKITFQKKQVMLFNDRWENGEIDILELIRSQNSLENSKVTLIQQKTGYMELYAEYLYEIGR
ncbi:MAG: TolC family protein [Verrucomicrobiota bacterium]|nr:TolC family protein [Verrucomicrobiota bacterium]